MKPASTPDYKREVKTERERMAKVIKKLVPNCFPSIRELFHFIVSEESS